MESSISKNDTNFIEDMKIQHFEVHQGDWQTYYSFIYKVQMWLLMQLLCQNDEDLTVHYSNLVMTVAEEFFWG